MSQVASRLGDLESGNGSGTLPTTRPFLVNIDPHV
jgi:hypothetical protein